MLLDTDLPTTLEVLNGKDEVLSGMAARVCHLDGDWAFLTLPPGQAPSCLHWGSRVRFRFGEKAASYEVVGVVTGHETNSESEEIAPLREVRVRLLTCGHVSQRRSEPRRFARCLAQLRPLATPAPRAQSGEEEEDPTCDETWTAAQCVDISGSGIRLRIPAAAAPPDQIQIQVALPAFTAAKNKKDVGPLLCVQGRVLRRALCGKHNDLLEIAVKFETLSVADGLLLSHFLCH